MLSEKRIDQPFIDRTHDNQELIDKLRDRNNRIDKQLGELKNNINLVKNKRKLLTRSEDLKNYNDVTVTRLLAKRFPTRFNEENYNKCIHEIQVALLYLSAFIVITALSWLFISNTNFLVESDFSYNVGLLGGFLMLCSIFYALLKRIKFIYAMGHNETWFYAHLVCGVVGTMLIIFHTTFKFNSFNSTVSLICLSLVIVSGIFGRYVCTLLSFKMQRIYQRIGDQELLLVNSLARHHQSTDKSVKFSVSNLLVVGINKANRWYNYAPALVKLPYYSFALFAKLNRNLKSIFDKVAERHDWDGAKLKIVNRNNRTLARNYVVNIVLLSLTNIASSMLTHWRTIHTSVLVLLTFTAVGHVLAVHMY